MKLSLLEAAHHEKKDLSGYLRKPEAKEFSLEIEIVTYADMFSALSEERPYRKSMSLSDVKKLLENEFKDIVGDNVYGIFCELGEELYKEIKTIRLDVDKYYSKIAVA